MGTGSHLAFMEIDYGAAPEPGSVALLGVGLLGACAISGRRRLFSRT